MEKMKTMEVMKPIPKTSNPTNFLYNGEKNASKKSRNHQVT